MAFMMPVLKNDYDIYKSNRQRRMSECSQTSAACRSRKVSECRSEGPSLSTSPGSDFITSPTHRSVPANMSSKQYTRANSRTSSNSLQSPMKSESCSPPKCTASTTSLKKFHNNVLDRLKRSLKHNKDADSEKTSS